MNLSGLNVCGLLNIVIGLGSSWHLSEINIEDLKTNQKFQFPCNRWLSKSEDDKQLVRELSCANIASPKNKDKIGNFYFKFN